jgi:hypothetical protein
MIKEKRKGQVTMIIIAQNSTAQQVYYLHYKNSYIYITRVQYIEVDSTINSLPNIFLNSILYEIALFCIVVHCMY